MILRTQTYEDKSDYLLVGLRQNTRRGLRGGNDSDFRLALSLSKPCGPFLERIPLMLNLVSKSRSLFIGLTLFATAFVIAGCSSTAVTSAESTNTETSESASAAAVGYRYWGYSQSSEDGKSWNTAMEGPATTQPADGSVEGWNYTFSAEGAVDPAAPSMQPDFATLCSQTQSTDGEKRIGFVIEFGDPVIYPEGDSAPQPSSGCVSVPSNASGLEVLNKVASVRAGEGGFICGINGFPSKDCGADPIAIPESLKKK